MLSGQHLRWHRLIIGWLVLAGPLASCLAVTNVASLAQEWVVRSWQTKDGLPQNTVNTIVQTRDGYLWLGTSAGLARFDGAGFRTFGLEDGLPSVEIVALAEDTQSGLWIGTTGGGLCRLNNGQFTNFGSAEGFNGGAVHNLAAGRDGTVWIGTEQGLFKWHNGSISCVGKTEGLPEGNVRGLLEDSKGSLWVSVLLKGVFHLSNGRFVPVETLGRPQETYTLFEARDGAIWAGCGNGLLWELNRGTWTCYSRTNGLPTDSIMCMAEGSQGEMWAAFWSSGLYCLREGTFRKMTQQQGLSDNRVRVVTVDREGTVWAGTGAGGLNRLTQKLVVDWGAAEGLGGHAVTSMVQDGSGSIWAGTHNNGVYRLQDGRFTRANDGDKLSFYPFIYSLVTGTDGSVWAGGESVLQRFRPGEAVTVYRDNLLTDQAIRAMCVDGQTLWLGTYYGSLLRFDGTKVKSETTNGYFRGDIRSVVREAPETLWIGSANGLYRWDHGNTRMWGTRDGLLTPAVQTLCREDDGTLWIGTQGGGLARMKDGRINNITMKQGLIDDVISQIMPDAHGHLWLGCNKGIMRLNRREAVEVAEGESAFLQVRLVDESEGMRTAQCSGGHSPTVLKTKEGRLFFPTLGGVVEIGEREWVDRANMPPKPTIEEVLLEGESQGHGPSIVIPPGSRHLELDYSAPSLLGADHVRFRFQLEPFDKDWVDAGARRSVFYPNLRPGHYEFRVATGDYQGNWNPEFASLSIIVRPFFWQSRWFQAAAVLLVAGAAWGWYGQRISRLHQKRAAQEAFTRELILSQEEERKRVAFELHDGLGQDLLLIKNRLALLLESGKHPAEITREIQDISINASRAIADVRTISHGLRPGALEHVGLTEALRAMVEDIGKSSRTKFSTELENLDGCLNPELEINLYRIVQEALNNVLKHSSATRVTVEARREAEQITISIFDNGQGFIPPNGSANGNGNPSFGLRGMSERAKVLGGQLEIQSALGTGTRLTLLVPLQHKLNFT